MALRKASNETNLIIKEKGLHFNIETRSIKLLEGYGSYTHIHTADKVYIVSKTIKSYSSYYPISSFALIVPLLSIKNRCAH